MGQAVVPRASRAGKKRAALSGTAEFREETSKKGRQPCNAGLLLFALVVPTTRKRKMLRRTMRNAGWRYWFHSGSAESAASLTGDDPCPGAPAPEFGCPSRASHKLVPLHSDFDRLVVLSE